MSSDGIGKSGDYWGAVSKAEGPQ